MRKLRLLLVVALAAFSLSVFGQTAEELFDQGYNYFEKEDYTQAFPLLKESADKGCIPAQALVGSLYYGGYGVEQDYKMAFNMLQKVANCGIEEYEESVCQLLYVMYLEGHGVPHDDDKAIELFCKGLETNPAEAILYIASDYYQIEEDAKAAKWYRKAAELGIAEAQLQLGAMYMIGAGVEKDLSKAAEWLGKAAVQENFDAQYLLGLMYAEGEGVQQDYTEAAKWYRKAAEQGDADAQCKLGAMYFLGTGIEQNQAKAIEWLQKAAAQGQQDAIDMLEGMK